MSLCRDFDYAIGNSPSVLITLRSMRIPAPDQVVFRPYAILRPRADFSRVGDGFASFDWIYDISALSTLYKLLTFLQGNESQQVYVRTDQRTADYPNPEPSFKLYQAIMWKPALSGSEGVWVARSPYAIQTPKISFVNAIELEGYM